MAKQYQFMKPYQFTNGAKLQNHIVMAPVTTQSSFFDGTVSDDEINFYRMRSGVGMIIVEVANINATGKGFEGELSVAEDRFIPGLAKIANAIHSKGSKAILQIFDAGRKPLIEVGNVQTPEDADEALSDGASLVAMGRELLREPNWIEKVATRDEKSIRYHLSPVDMDLVGLPGGLQRELRTGFLNAMNFTDQKTTSFLNKFGQVEGFGG